MKIELFDGDTAPESELRERYDFGCRMDAEMDPETPHEPYEAWLKHMRTKSTFYDTLRWVVRDNGALVASAYLGLSRADDNRHLCRGDATVAPEYRRQGIGAGLLAEMVDAAEADGRTVFGTGTVQGHESEQFLKAMGLEQKLLDRRSRLHIDQIPEGMLDQWIADAAVKAAGYSLVTIDKKVQPEYRERFIDVLNAMNDAPREGLDREDEFVTMEQLEDWERQTEETGGEDSFLVVMHDESGDFAGYTGIEWRPELPSVLWQGGTAVKAAHRGHAIGRWLKAANLAAVLEKNPEARFVDTWNAGSNKWMLAINDELGFAPYIWYTAWQGKTADIKASLAAK
ncbi:MAG: GNAT family N-acetyltransferase [Acidimicrobiales bacterium]|nr:GNAT family N-acetyltransferase [Acidimicrobiales bacterium]